MSDTVRTLNTEGRQSMVTRRYRIELTVDVTALPMNALDHAEAFASHVASEAHKLARFLSPAPPHPEGARFGNVRLTLTRQEGRIK
jgi:hypothetical protein